MILGMKLRSFLQLQIHLCISLTLIKTYEMLTSVILLRFYIYEVKQPTLSHKTFEEKLKKFHTMIVEQGNAKQSEEYVLSYAVKLSELMTLATSVIKTERNKL